MRVARFASMVGLVLIMAAAGTQAAQPTPAETAERARQQAMPDTPGTGRYPAMKEEIASLPNQVLYRPADLAAMGSTKLGVYLFGNGACVDDGAMAPARPAPASQSPQDNVKTSYRDLLAAIDWAIAQNADSTSPFHNRIDTTAIAASGYSCGGAQAMRVAADPRVKTLVMMNSGLFPDGQSAAIPEQDVRKAALQQIHTPVLYVIGGESDAAWVNSQDDFSRINHVPIVVANLDGVGHGGTFWQPNGGKAATAVVAWLDWQLRGDKTAATQFVGTDCGLCRNADWTVQKKRID